MLQLAGTAVGFTLATRTTAAWHVIQRAVEMTVNTMGTTLFAVGAAILLFVVMVVRKGRREGWTAMKNDLLGDVGYSVTLGIVLWLLVLLWNVTITIHDDHRRFVAQVDALATENAELKKQIGTSATEAQRKLADERQELLRRNAKLQAELFERTHTISTQTPAFSNINELVNAFRSWRATIGPAVPCRVEITAPPDAQDIALATGQLSVIGSNCPTFGPSDWSMDPDEERKAKTGMVPKTVVIHIAKGVRGDVNLYNALQNLFIVKRSYDVPPGQPENFVWLQFGTGTKWNSQLR